MKTNFERIKDRLYNYIMSRSQEIGIAITIQSITSNRFQSFYKSEEQFKDDLNKWLASLDVRSIEGMKRDLKGTNVLPKFMYTGKYCIDYNKNGFLDIMQIKNVCEC